MVRHSRKELFQGVVPKSATGVLPFDLWKCVLVPKTTISVYHYVLRKVNGCRDCIENWVILVCGRVITVSFQCTKQGAPWLSLCLPLKPTYIYIYILSIFMHKYQQHPREIPFLQLLRKHDMYLFSHQPNNAWKYSTVQVRWASAFHLWNSSFIYSSCTFDIVLATSPSVVYRSVL